MFFIIYRFSYDWGYVMALDIQPILTRGIEALEKENIFEKVHLGEVKVSQVESEVKALFNGRGLIRNYEKDYFTSTRLIEPHQPSIKENINISGDPILQTYLDKLKCFNKSSQVKILYNTNIQEYQHPMFLFREPMKFDNALDFLTNQINEFNPFTLPVKTTINHNNFDLYREAIINGGIPNVPIKGVIGQGASNTAFLFENYVIKLSTLPHFPAEEHVIRGLDIPICKNGRYVVPVCSGTKKVYGSITPLKELAAVRFDLANPQDLAEFNKHYDALSDILLKAGKNYVFDDFPRGKEKALWQMGIAGNKPCLLDSTSVVGRPLVI